MKNLSIAFIVIFLMIMALSSCTKCYTCNFSGDVQKLCPKNFPDGEKDLKLSVNAYEAEGYVCTAD
jgi:hypothetical protein